MREQDRRKPISLVHRAFHERHGTYARQEGALEQRFQDAMLDVVNACRKPLADH